MHHFTTDRIHTVNIASWLISVPTSIFIKENRIVELCLWRILFLERGREWQVHCKHTQTYMYMYIQTTPSHLISIKNIPVRKTPKCLTSSSKEWKKGRCNGRAQNNSWSLDTNLPSNFLQHTTKYYQPNKTTYVQPNTTSEHTSEHTQIYKWPIHGTRCWCLTLCFAMELLQCTWCRLGKYYYMVIRSASMLCTPVFFRAWTLLFVLEVQPTMPLPPSLHWLTSGIHSDVLKHFKAYHEISSAGENPFTSIILVTNAIQCCFKTKEKYWNIWHLSSICKFEH